jgi:hypothetical protein
MSGKRVSFTRTYAISSEWPTIRPESSHPRTPMELLGLGARYTVLRPCLWNDVNHRLGLIYHAGRQTNLSRQSVARCDPLRMEQRVPSSPALIEPETSECAVSGPRLL